MCNLAQIALDRLLNAALPDTWWAPTTSWTVSYTLSVSLRHFSHAICVFGQHSESTMCVALGKTYLAYASTIVISTAINLALVAVRDSNSQHAMHGMYILHDI